MKGHIKLNKSFRIRYKCLRYVTKNVFYITISTIIRGKFFYNNEVSVGTIIPD